MTKILGRPMIYAKFLVILDDDLVYSPGTIAHLGKEFGFFGNKKDTELVEALRRVRHSLNRFRINHDFPEPDGEVKLEGQTAAKAWFGSRWKAETPLAVREAAMNEIPEKTISEKVTYPSNVLSYHIFKFGE